MSGGDSDLKRRLTQAGLGVVILALTAAFIYSEIVVKTEVEPGVVEVAYWEKWGGFEGDAMRAVVDAFNEKKLLNADGDLIRVKLLQISAIQDKTMTAASAGIPPDIAGLFGPNVAQYVSNGAILPLDKYIERDGLGRDDYVHVYWDMGNLDGVQYALPSTPASTALHYNLDHWEAAGLDPNKPPITIEDLDAATEAITKFEGERMVRAGFLPSEPGWWRDRFGYIFGGKIWDGESKVTAASPENIRAFKWVQSYTDRFGTGAVRSFQSGFGGFDTAENGFFSGKVASVLQGVWMANFIEANAPDMKWAAVPFPHPADRPELAGSSYIDMDILVIPRGAAHPDEAWEFIKYVQSQEGMEMLCLGQKKHSPLADVSDEFWEKHENPFIRLFYDVSSSPNAIVPPKIAVWPEIASEMNAAYDTIANGGDVETALKKVDERMQPRLDKALKMRRMRNATK